MQIIKSRLLFVLIINLTVLSSCIVEEGTSADYIIKNDTDLDLKIKRFGGWDLNFTKTDSFHLNAGQEIVFNYYEDTGGAPPPFYSTDSLVFSHNDQLKKTYTPRMSEKNPFNIDFYEGGKTNYKNHITSYVYYFVIETNDLNK